MAQRSMKLFVFEVDTLYFGDPEEKVFVSAEEFSEWKRDGAGLQTRHSYLIEKWLKLVVVVFVEQHHLVVALSQFAN